MLLRLSLVAVGVVSMISGCNGLISTTFGTHRLRTFSIAEASRGVGDADYVQLTDARIADSMMTIVETEAKDTYYFAPVVDARDLVFAEKSRFVPIVWSETHPFPTELSGVTGTVEQPPVDVLLPAAFSDEAQAKKVLLPIHLNHRPLPWYWQATLFVCGLLLAGATEWWYQCKPLPQ